MDVPDTDGVKPEKLEEVKEEVLPFNCDLFDSEIIHKIALALFPGLGAACIDYTTGGLFRSPASVALDMRRTMVEYLTTRSETFVAESIILEDSPEASDHPYDIIADFIEDFVTSKRNIFSRVSGWILSERREDRIDDFVQDMEMDGFWIIERRESVAKTLLKNVDTKNLFHCGMKFSSKGELDEHCLNCSFRTMDCTHEGCDSRFSATHLENHESVCPFKIIPCEQKCSATIMRRQMDRHCITVCPMKIVNCPFYSAGCQSTFPQSEIEHHRVQTVLPHVVLVLRVIHKDAGDEDLDDRSKKVEEMASPGRLASARDVRSLTLTVKDIETKLGPLQVRPKNTVSEAQQELPTKETDSACVEKESSKEDNRQLIGSPPIKDEGLESTKDSNSPTVKKDPNGSSSMEGGLKVTEEEVDSKEANDSVPRQPNRSSSMRESFKTTEEEGDIKEPNDSVSVKGNLKDNTSQKNDNKESNDSSSINRSLDANEVHKEQNVSPQVKVSSKANEEDDSKEQNTPPPSIEGSHKDNKVEDISPMENRDYPVTN